MSITEKPQTILKYTQTICMEIETMFKQIAGTGASRISEYKDFILTDSHYRQIVSEKVRLRRGIELQPFAAWDSQRLTWWDDFCARKHYRTGRIASANLKTLLDVLAALHILELYYYNNCYYDSTDASMPSVPVRKSTLFRICNLNDNVSTELVHVFDEATKTGHMYSVEHSLEY